MRKIFHPHLFAGLSVFAIMTAPVSANGGLVQDEEPQEAEAPPEDSKQAIIESWPDQRRAAYELWPDETKEYYWTLTKERQKMFWGLADPDKITLSQMSDEDRAKVWERLEGGGSG